MGNIKTVSVSAETAVKFDSFYPYVWIKNTGDNIAYASSFSGIVAGAENVTAIPAGESVMITAETDTVYILSTGTTAEVHGQGYAESPFLDNYSEGSSALITVESLSANENGIYTAPSGKAYSPVTVAVPSDIQQINPFDSGASTISLYNSNGVEVNTSSISASGTGALNISESSAGYEGMVIELNSAAGHTYIVSFDYQNIDTQYMAGFVIGWLLENSARTDYEQYGNWASNLPLDGTKTQEMAFIKATGSKIYMNFNLCGYSDNQTNAIDITNLKVYDISLPQE